MIYPAFVISAFAFFLIPLIRTTLLFPKNSQIKARNLWRYSGYFHLNSRYKTKLNDDQIRLQEKLQSAQKHLKSRKS